jgi:dienelactone hydrolase
LRRAAYAGPGDDQNRVPQSRSNRDAFAGFRWLAAQPWVDRSRIVVLGMSRGGEAAYSAALDSLRERAGAADLRFAAHIAIAPGGCNFQQRNARTSGAPIFFMLAEFDEIGRVPACVEYAERMRTGLGTAPARPRGRLPVAPSRRSDMCLCLGEPGRRHD